MHSCHGYRVRRGVLEVSTWCMLFTSDAQNISDEQIQSQIDVLNKDFRARNSDLDRVPEVWRPLATDTQLEFRLAEVTRTRTDRDFFSDNDDVKLKSTSEGGHDVIDPDSTLTFGCVTRPVPRYAIDLGRSSRKRRVVIAIDFLAPK